MKNKQQKFGERNTYTPMDASQVCSSVAMSFNREETLGEHSLKTSPNNLDVNLHQQTGGLKAKVFVLNKNKEPVMPCKPAKARHLISDKKAVVISIKPFTIRLLFDCENKTQLITLGVDSGYKQVGFSATTDQKELISGELKLRTDVSKKIQDRAMYRKTRRGRLWHRKSRFDNRKRKEGWLPPSLEHKVQTHLNLVEKLKQIMPITKIIFEVAKFDAQKMQNPEISGVEYQQGELQGYEVREYLLEKYHRTCVYCSKKNIPLQMEHIIPKSRGGTNRVSNLAISCEKCNLKKGTKTASEFGHPDVEKKCKISLKSTPFMNVVRSRIVDLLKCDYTYGYITKHNRIKANIEKSHINDAFVISEGIIQKRTTSLVVEQTRRNNRKLQVNRKGFKSSIRRQRYKLQPKDTVRFENKVYSVKGVHCYGTRVQLFNGIDKSKSINIKKVTLNQYGKGLNFQSSSSLIFKIGGIV